MSKYTIKRHEKLISRRICIAVEYERDGVSLKRGRVFMLPTPILLWYNEGIGYFNTGQSGSGFEWFETCELAVGVWFLFWGANVSLSFLKRRA